MIAAFSDFSIRVVYEAVERWEEIIDDAEAAGVSTQALESALVEAATADPTTNTAATVELVELLSEVAAATHDVSDAAKNTLEAAVEATTDAVAAAQATPDLALQVLIATTSAAATTGEPAKVEDVRQAVKRVFKGYDWVAKYQAIPGPSMGWHSLVELRRDDDRDARDRRAALFARTSTT